VQPEAQQQDGGIAHQVRGEFRAVERRQPLPIERQQRLDAVNVGASQARGADRLEVMQRPQDAAGAEVERVERLRLAIVGVAGVSRPVRADREAGLGVVDDALDRGARPSLVPGDGQERLVSGRIVQHAVGVSPLGRNIRANDQTRLR
jgi:hypothetical protein